MGELLPQEIEMARRMDYKSTSIDDQLADGQTVQTALLTVPNNNAARHDSDNVSLVSVTLMDTEHRETWGKKIDFLLSVIGFAVDLSNVWRFPYLCYKNGGGVFLIPYLIMLFLAGIPLFFMELALGQYYRQGAITCWGRVCPLFKGIGYGVVMIAFYVDFYYNVIIAWALHFFFASFTTGRLPWADCSNEWNSADCFDYRNWTTYHDNSTCAPLSDSLQISPADEYFYKKFHKVLKAGSASSVPVHTVENPGMIQWQHALALLAVYLICYFSLWKGIKMSGKVVWFTAIFPYVVLMCLLIRGVTLPGAMQGIEKYVKPNLTMLNNGEIWFDAATQVFYSLGPGFGVLLAFASYNKFHNNVYRDALITASINCLTSVLAGFVIFSVLGYMQCKSGRPFDQVATQGPGLVFVVYPEALSTMPYPTLWSMLFFMMLLTLGLDSSFGGSEAIITALSDEFLWIKKHRELFVGLLFSLYWLIGLTMCTEGGIMFVEFIDGTAASSGLMILVFCESVIISWIYGLNRFCSDIHEMLGFKPGLYWRFCWKFMGPLFLGVILVYGIYSKEPFNYMGYLFPWYFQLLSWILGISSAMAIPILGVSQIIHAPGIGFVEKFRATLRPWKDTVEPKSRLTNHEQTPLNLNMT